MNKGAVDFNEREEVRKLQKEHVPIQHLLRTLLDNTTDGKVDWKETIKDNTYRVMFPSGAIEIGLDGAPDNNDNIEFYVTIRDNYGQDLISVYEHEMPDGLLEQVHNEASKKFAIKVNETILKIINEVKEGK